ncbi:MAG: SGNH/GDSL hydrolase N-terminal domain-containing protein [Kiritimatiellia bacterium]
MPTRAGESVPGPVWNLSHHSAGMALHFVSDGGSFRIKWVLKNKHLSKRHMLATGVSGIDIYSRTPEGWRFVKNGQALNMTNEMTVSISLKNEDPELGKKLHYLKADEMLGHDFEGTVDGVHPNDIGMMRMGKIFSKAIKEILIK